MEIESQAENIGRHEAEARVAEKKLPDATLELMQSQYDAGMNLGKMQLATQIIVLLSKETRTKDEQEVFDFCKEVIDKLGK